MNKTSLQMGEWQLITIGNLERRGKNLLTMQHDKSSEHLSLISRSEEKDSLPLQDMSTYHQKAAMLNKKIRQEHGILDDFHRILNDIAAIDIVQRLIP